MAANEIKERIAAHAWLRLGPKVSDISALNNPSIGFRSQVGFVERVITTTDADAYPLLILELDRELVRSQNQVLAYLVGTVDDAGRSYPQPELGDSPRLPNVEAIHTSWIGDYADPSWLPFTSEPVPDFAARNLDKFNAVALLLPAQSQEVGVLAYAGDVCVLVLQSPIGAPSPNAAPIIPPPGPPGPVAKFYHYYAPGTASAEGTVLLWPDTGDAPPSDATQPNALQAPATFDHSVPLNNLQVIVEQDERLQFMDAAFASYGETFSFAIVGAIDEGHQEGKLWELGGDVTGFISVNYNVDTDGWFLLTDTGSTPLGAATVLAVAVTMNADGSFAANYQLDWGAVQSAAGTFTSEPFTYQTVLGQSRSDDVGSIQIGEMRIRTLTAWNEAQRTLQLGELETTWGAPLTFLRWYGPDLTPAANIPSWVDQIQAANAVNAFAPLQPSASVGLNGLVTLHGPAAHPLICSAVPTPRDGAHGLAIAFVIVVPANAENLFQLLSNGDDTMGLLVQYFTVAGPSLQVLMYTDTDSNGFEIGDGPGTYAGVAWWNPSTGDVRVTVTKDWDPPTLIETNAGFTWEGASLVSVATINSAEPEPSVAIAEMGEFVDYVGPMTAAHQTSIVAALESTWKPPDIFP